MHVCVLIIFEPNSFLNSFRIEPFIFPKFVSSVFSPFFVTYIQYMLLIYSLVCGHPLDHELCTEVTSLNKTDSPFPGSHQPPIAPQLEVGAVSS